MLVCNHSNLDLNLYGLGIQDSRLSVLTCSENVKTMLDMLTRHIENGCIVKIHREVLFDHLTRQQSLSYPHIYGIVTNLGEVCPHSGLRAWEVRLFLSTIVFCRQITTIVILPHR